MGQSNPAKAAPRQRPKPWDPVRHAAERRPVMPGRYGIPQTTRFVRREPRNLVRDVAEDDAKLRAPLLNTARPRTQLTRELSRAAKRRRLGRIVRPWPGGLTCDR
jgi:hypothetical protein